MEKKLEQFQSYLLNRISFCEKRMTSHKTGYQEDITGFEEEEAYYQGLYKAYVDIEKAFSSQFLQASPTVETHEQT